MDKTDIVTLKKTLRNLLKEDLSGMEFEAMIKSDGGCLFRHQKRP